MKLTIKHLIDALAKSTKGVWGTEDSFVFADRNMRVADCECAGQDMPDDEIKANAQFIAAAHELAPHLIRSFEMVREACNLVSDAMENHIYNEANGEAPEADCLYAKFLQDAYTLLVDLTGGKHITGIIHSVQTQSKGDLPITGVKRFNAVWGDGFVKPGSKIVGENFFTEDNGYEQIDIEEINKLRLGDAWHSKDSGTHHVIRLQDIL